MNFREELKKAYLIRKTEEQCLLLFKQGKISGTVHTCVGQEYTGVFASKHSIKGDFVASNHRGHGHYLSFTNDLNGLVAELLGSEKGCSRGIGGSQHLYNGTFLSNGIQGGMLPVAAGVGYSNKVKKNGHIAIAFLGKGTLGEGVLYETLNLSASWKIPIIFILERNNISQATDFHQNFYGDLEKRICGFGVKYFKATIYEMEKLNHTFHEAIRLTRAGEPVFLDVEVARLNSHSKGDENRDESTIRDLKKKDPLNVFISNNKETIELWNGKIDGLIVKAIKYSSSPNNKKG